MGLGEQLSGDCRIQLLGFDEVEGRHAFWHSSAHVLGAAVEQVFDEAQLTIGPAISDGFYYDFHSPTG